MNESNNENSEVTAENLTDEQIREYRSALHEAMAKRLTMRQAADLAERFWSKSGNACAETVGIVQRLKKSPRFKVGMAYLDGTKAVTFGSSNVDWECAFVNAALAGHCTMDASFDPNQAVQVFVPTAAVVDCDECGADPGEPCRTDRPGQPPSKRTHSARVKRVRTRSK